MGLLFNTIYFTIVVYLIGPPYVCSYPMQTELCLFAEERSWPNCAMLSSVFLCLVFHDAVRVIFANFVALHLSIPLAPMGIKEITIPAFSFEYVLFCRLTTLDSGAGCIMNQCSPHITIFCCSGSERPENGKIYTQTRPSTGWPKKLVTCRFIILNIIKNR